MRHICTSIVATLVLASTGIAWADDAVQWTEAEGGNGHWYQHVEELRSWHEAQQAAMLVGGHLATSTSAEEQAKIADVALDEKCWLGGEDSGSEWQWITGETWSYTNWAVNEPSDGVEDYLEMLVGGQWADSEAGSEENVGYLVEWSADCNGDGIVDYGQILDGSLADDNGNGVPDCCDDTSCQAGVQWKVEDGGNGHWYKVSINDTALCWLEAEATAMAIGGQLASLETVEEFNFASTHIDSQGGSLDTWIGLRQDEDGAEPADGWRWLSGVELDYNLWLGSLDDGNGCQDFARLEAGGCDDVYPCVEEECIHSTYEDQMLVEWSADCNGDGIVDYGQILDGSLADNNGNGIPDICQQFDMGACCLAGTCVMTTATHCFEALGSYAGDGITCEDAGCPAPCPGDIDGDGQIGIVELLVVIDRWGICP